MASTTMLTIATTLDTLSLFFIFYHASHGKPYRKNHYRKYDYCPHATFPFP